MPNDPNVYATGELVRPRSEDNPTGIWAPLNAVPDRCVGCTYVPAPPTAGASPTVTGTVVGTVIVLPHEPRARLVRLARLLLASAATAALAAFPEGLLQRSYVLDWACAAGRQSM